jgi:hypothetical protein
LLLALDFQSRAAAVGHAVILTASTKVMPSWCSLAGLWRMAVRLAALLLSREVVVGHPVEPLSDVRGSDARSAQIGSCCGIAQRFQVSENSGEPFTSILARNLLAKDNCRSALADETAELRPKVTRVRRPQSLASRREWLAWA